MICAAVACYVKSKFALRDKDAASAILEPTLIAQCLTRIWVEETLRIERDGESGCVMMGGGTLYLVGVPPVFTEEANQAWKDIFGDFNVVGSNQNWCFLARYHAWFNPADFAPLMADKLPKHELYPDEELNLKKLQEKFSCFISSGETQNRELVTWCLSKRYLLFCSEVASFNEKNAPCVNLVGANVIRAGFTASSACLEVKLN